MMPWLSRHQCCCAGAWPGDVPCAGRAHCFGAGWPWCPSARAVAGFSVVPPASGWGRGSSTSSWSRRYSWLPSRWRWHSPGRGGWWSRRSSPLPLASPWWSPWWCSPSRGPYGRPLTSSCGPSNLARGSRLAWNSINSLPTGHHQRRATVGTQRTEWDRREFPAASSSVTTIRPVTTMGRAQDWSLLVRQPYRGPREGNQ